MKRTIHFLTLAVLMGISAGLSAQTAFRAPVSPTPVLKTPAPAVPVQTSCPPVLDRQTILEELRKSWTQQYQETLKAQMEAYKACVSDCLGRYDLSSLPADDPNDPKDFSVSTIVGACREECS